MLNKIQLNKKIITSLILLAFFISIIGILTPTTINQVTNTEIINPLSPINDEVKDNNIKLSLNAGVDLVVDSITIPNTVIEYGVSPYTAITFTIKNVGTDPINNTIIYAELVNVTKDGLPSTSGGYFGISSYTAPLKSGDTVSHSFLVGHDAVWPVGAYTLRVKVDSRFGGTEYITEVDESNNVSPEISFFVGNPGVDLVISDISIPTTIIVSNQTPWTRITFVIRNIGVFPLNDSSITADLVNVTKDGSPYTPGGFMEVNTYSVPLFPGQTASWTFAVGHDAAWPVGEYSLQVYTDHRGTSTYIPESNELNNLSPELRFSVVPADTRPDLIISDITIPTTVIQYGATPWTWVDFTVKNVGSGPVTNSSIIGDLVNVLKNGASFPIGGYFNVINFSAPLNPGDIATHSFAVGHDTVWPVGEYSIQVRIDAWNYENETDESNNLSPELRFIVIEEGQVNPIIINGNDDFQAAGFSGDGSANNPYVLENVIISNSTAPLVEIHNTDAYFVIRNSRLDGLNGGFPAIIFDNVMNGRLDDNHIQRVSTGVFFNYTSNSFVNSNIIGNNSEYGVWFVDSSNNEITFNEIGNNGFDGIFFKSSSYNLILGNRIYSNGYGSTIRLSISGTASINGLKASFGAGIFLDPSPFNVLDDNEVFDNAQNGIQLLESNYTLAIENNVYGNGLGGISILNSSHGIFSGNQVNFNGLQAPSVQSSKFARLSINSPDSLQASFGAGIFLDPSFNTTIYQNTVEGNYGEGIYLFVTTLTDISGNTVKNNGLSGILFKIHLNLISPIMKLLATVLVQL
ncbi:MAG: hypothetical protein HeimC3_29560 [Candidatus Heimdallarchaeota archaeon LC_3]|nr:MAG: hypothetical protein HeimC3_29560 [Candidatus Heimdallarchaeota archaeon LC_3]